jgi:ATP-binding cassette subfamily F protein uup
MDEPTNDLDIETLEILEDMLLAYTGTLLLVSHDRAFLNNLVTSTIALDGMGGAKETVGGYDDWLRQSQEDAARRPEAKEMKPVPVAGVLAVPAVTETGPKRLSFKEQRALEAQRQELAELPARIEALETEQHRLSAEMGNPAFYQRDSAEIALSASRLKALEDELAQAYRRWEELEA